MWTKLWFLASILLASTAFSEPKLVRDGDIVEIELSEKGQTRIYFTGGVRIDEVRGKGENLKFEENKEKGEVYVTVSEKSKIPLRFFLTDSNNATYIISATVKDIPTNAVQLKSPKRANPSDNAKKTSKTTDQFRKRIKSIMKSLALFDRDKGDWSTDVEGFDRRINGKQVRLVEEVAFNDLLGEIYIVTNTTNKTLKLDESEFTVIGSEVHAVGVREILLKPGKSTHLFLIRKLSGALDE